MTDDLLHRLSALDEARPLPGNLASRLERVLMGEAEGMGDLAVADAPRPIPQPARDRMEDTMVRVAVMRPLPTPLRNRLERQLTHRRESTWRRAAVAASVLFLLATTAAFVTDRPTPEPSGTGEIAAGSASESSDTETALVAGDPLAGGLSAPGNPGAGGSAFGAGSTAGAQSIRYRPYPAPPYSVVEEAASVGNEAPPGETLASSAGPPPEVRDSPPLEPLRIGVTGGDEAQEAGFRAYVALVNSQGGAGGHRLDPVPAGSSGTIATVNLSGASMADNAGPPPGTVTPLVESVSAFEPALRGSVFSLSSVPERQAHLAVEAALGTGGAGRRAVVFAARSGPFASRVPEALEAALRARRVDVVRVRWDPAVPTPLLGADVAFVSLPTEEARGWLRSAKGSGYAPAAGIWGVWSLADESLLADMPSNVRSLSPYDLVAGDELRDLVARTGRTPGAPLVHGWATAKWLAVSIWSSQADDNAELSKALSGPGFRSGFSPPLAYRKETHSRTPEAIVLKPVDGRLVADGGFRRDGAP